MAPLCPLSRSIAAKEPMVWHLTSVPMHRFRALVFVVISLVRPVWATFALTPAEQKALARWLEGHPAFRVATTADCDCADDIQPMRTVSDWGVEGSSGLRSVPSARRLER
jgi:hypothetical protein